MPADSRQSARPSHAGSLTEVGVAIEVAMERVVSAIKLPARTVAHLRRNVRHRPDATAKTWKTGLRKLVSEWNWECAYVYKPGVVRSFRDR